MARSAICLLGLTLALALGGCGPEAAPAAPEPRGGLGRVVRVVDGDTVAVRIGSRLERVRLLGIDAPQRPGGGGFGECGGDQAQRALERFALGATGGRGVRVRISFDLQQERRDRAGRLIAYADLAPGRGLAERQLEAGLAEPYVYRGRRFERLAEYRTLSAAARRRSSGIFGACGGAFHRSEESD